MRYADGAAHPSRFLDSMTSVCQSEKLDPGVLAVAKPAEALIYSLVVQLFRLQNRL